jgi:hypothetical protein
MLVVDAGTGRQDVVGGTLCEDNRVPDELRELVRVWVERENVEVRLESTFMVRDLVRVLFGGGPGGMGPRR